MSDSKVVLWDVDGTLVDYAISMEEFLEKRLEPLGVALDSLPTEDIEAAEDERLRQQDTWRTPQDERNGFVQVASILLRSAGLARRQIEEVADSFCRYFDLYRLVPGVRSILDELKRIGVRQGVVSNWPPSLHGFLRHHDLTRYFEIVVCSGEVGIVKPDLKIFELAFDAMNVLGPDCIYIGDNPINDVRPAWKLGMQAIHFNPRGNHMTADERTALGLRRRLFGMLGIADSKAAH